jgi:hypothetical protein
VTSDILASVPRWNRLVSRGAEPGANPVAPVVMVVTDRYLAWFTEAWEACTWLYIALAHHWMGAKKDAESA